MGHQTPTIAWAIWRRRAAVLAVLAPFYGPAHAGPDATPSPDIRSYCTNIAAAATDARFAWQTARLKEIEVRVQSRIKDLDAKTAELKDWIDKRTELEKQAGDKLVGIYAKMRPETAATQIGTLPDDMAAAVLGQMNARQASAIFNEIAPDRAAKLAGLIAGIPQPDDKKL